MHPTEPNDTQQKTVYFVRHGQSLDNTRPVFPWPDGPLSKLGEQQAEQVAARLSELSFETLISSPLQRARQTAERVSARTDKPIVFSELFVERTKPTALDGKPWSDPASDKLFREWKRSLFSHDMRVQDGENYADLITRADAALDFLLQRDEQTMAVVTHGFFLSVMLARVLTGEGLTPPVLETFQDRVMLENTSLTVLRYCDDHFNETRAWRLWAFNDHSHFAE